VALPGGQCPQRHSLIQLHILPDDRGLAHHDAGAVIDEEVGADLCAGVNIDARAAVGVLTHDPGDHGNLAQIQLMGHPVYENGKQPRIGEQNLLLGGRRRVGFKGGVQIRQQQPLHAGQGLHHLTGQHCSSGRAKAICRASWPSMRSSSSAV